MEVEGEFGEAPLGGFDESVLGRVRQIDGVATAEGIIGDPTIAILDEDGERIEVEQGPPHIAASTVEADEFESLTVIEGEGPSPMTNSRSTRTAPRTPGSKSATWSRSPVRRAPRNTR